MMGQCSSKGAPVCRGGMFQDIGLKVVWQEWDLEQWGIHSTKNEGNPALNQYCRWPRSDDRTRTCKIGEPPEVLRKILMMDMTGLLEGPGDG